MWGSEDITATVILSFTNGLGWSESELRTVNQSCGRTETFGTYLVFVRDLEQQCHETRQKQRNLRCCHCLIVIRA